MKLDSWNRVVIQAQTSLTDNFVHYTITVVFSTAIRRSMLLLLQAKVYNREKKTPHCLTIKARTKDTACCHSKTDSYKEKIR